MAEKLGLTVLSSIHKILDKKKEVETEMQELLRRRDNELLEVVVTLRDGTGFGELALDAKNTKPRAATIRCIDNVEVATMNKADYNKILHKIEHRNKIKLINFFKSIPCLAKNSQTYLSKLHYSFEQKSFIRNQEIVKEGGFADFVYIIKSGEVEITKKIKVKEPITKKDDKKKRQKPQINTFRVAILGPG